MIPQALITWVKSMFGRIGYSNTYQATEIKGNLNTTGYIRSTKGVYADYFGAYTNPANQIKFNYNSIVLTSNGDVLIIDNGGVTSNKPATVNGNLSIASGRTLKIGSTTLSEAQLQKLIALIPAE